MSEWSTGEPVLSFVDRIGVCVDIVGVGVEILCESANGMVIIVIIGFE